MIHIVFGILIQTCIFLIFSFEQLLDRPTFIIIFFTFSYYTYGLIVHLMLVMKTCLSCILVIIREQVEFMSIGNIIFYEEEGL